VDGTILQLDGDFANASKVCPGRRANASEPPANSRLRGLIDKNFGKRVQTRLIENYGLVIQIWIIYDIAQKHVK
jgi:hypothetical protein